MDGMGGGIGAQTIERLRKENIPGLAILALGTNALATQRMLEAGADKGATGENAIAVSAQKADLIVGPVGITMPNSMLGEISPRMAEAVMNSDAEKFLLPMGQQNVRLMGLAQKSLNELLDELASNVKNSAVAHSIDDTPWWLL
jgi:hypothetical protein